MVVEEERPSSPGDRDDRPSPTSDQWEDEFSSPSAKALDDESAAAKRKQANRKKRDRLKARRAAERDEVAQSLGLDFLTTTTGTGTGQLRDEAEYDEEDRVAASDDEEEPDWLQEARRSFSETPPPKTPTSRADPGPVLVPVPASAAERALDGFAHLSDMDAGIDPAHTDETPAHGSAVGNEGDEPGWLQTAAFVLHESSPEKSPLPSSVVRLATESRAKSHADLLASSSSAPLSPVASPVPSDDPQALQSELRLGFEEDDRKSAVQVAAGGSANGHRREAAACRRAGAASSDSAVDSAPRPAAHRPAANRSLFQPLLEAAEIVHDAPTTLAASKIPSGVAAHHEAPSASSASTPSSTRPAARRSLVCLALALFSLVLMETCCVACCAVAFLCSPLASKGGRNDAQATPAFAPPSRGEGGRQPDTPGIRRICHLCGSSGGTSPDTDRFAAMQGDVGPPVSPAAPEGAADDQRLEGPHGNTNAACPAHHDHRASTHLASGTCIGRLWRLAALCSLVPFLAARAQGMGDGPDHPRLYPLTDDLVWLVSLLGTACQWAGAGCVIVALGGEAVGAMIATPSPISPSPE